MRLNVLPIALLAMMIAPMITSCKLRTRLDLASSSVEFSALQRARLRYGVTWLVSGRHWFISMTSTSRSLAPVCDMSNRLSPQCQYSVPDLDHNRNQLAYSENPMFRLRQIRKTQARSNLTDCARSYFEGHLVFTVHFSSVRPLHRNAVATVIGHRLSLCEWVGALDDLGY